MMDKIERRNIMDKAIIILNSSYGIFINFSNITVLRTEESFNNVNYNYIQIGIFVLLMLFYWCAEYVFSMNKKYIKANYPEIAI